MLNIQILLILKICLFFKAHAIENVTKVSLLLFRAINYANCPGHSLDLPILKKTLNKEVFFKQKETFAEFTLVFDDTLLSQEWKMHSLLRHIKIVDVSNMLNSSDFPLLVSNVFFKKCHIYF